VSCWSSFSSETVILEVDADGMFRLSTAIYQELALCQNELELNLKTSGTGDIE